MSKQLGISVVTVGIVIGISMMIMTMQPDDVENAPLSHTESTLATISAGEFASALGNNPDRIVVDIRTPAEFVSGRIAGARNIDFYEPDFLTRFESFDKDQSLAIYCRSGSRSGRALDQLRQAGFTDVINLSGGIVAWTESNRELQRGCEPQQC